MTAEHQKSDDLVRLADEVMGASDGVVELADRAGQKLLVVKSSMGNADGLRGESVFATGMAALFALGATAGRTMKRVEPLPSFGVKSKELSAPEKWAQSLQLRNRVLNRNAPKNRKLCTNLKKMRRQVREQLKAAKQRIQNQIVADEVRYVIEQGEDIQPAAGGAR